MGGGVGGGATYAAQQITRRSRRPGQMEMPTLQLLARKWAEKKKM